MGSVHKKQVRGFVSSSKMPLVTKLCLQGRSLLVMLILHVFTCVWVGGGLLVSAVCAQQLTDSHTGSEQKAPPESSDICTNTHSLKSAQTHGSPWFGIQFALVLGCVHGDGG
ncbi:hypothetical protein AMECASPLE_037070 [Ameca splendens]|uniref:Uncharacterized protein n=1 Tax=Ameca splendens TaxID=208324 RepID=A0ABV0XKW7_9TELE